jgi:hypothetical protein
MIVNAAAACYGYRYASIKRRIDVSVSEFLTLAVILYVWAAERVADFFFLFFFFKKSYPHRQDTRSETNEKRDREAKSLLGFFFCCYNKTIMTKRCWTG